ncbi:hypothetical protein J2S74_003781 [Evansella vedderi]|uniref:Uncharacterized protein n=1 Tax=Evansella vedderi TaxID=38282 RepID=A0ABU0A065_9BACI|nr:hypothetical protein [Evansella vedderi]
MCGFIGEISNISEEGGHQPFIYENERFLTGKFIILSNYVKS